MTVVKMLFKKQTIVMVAVKHSGTKNKHKTWKY